VVESKTPPPKQSSREMTIFLILAVCGSALVLIQYLPMAKGIIPNQFLTSLMMRMTILPKMREKIPKMTMATTFAPESSMTWP